MARIGYRIPRRSSRISLPTLFCLLPVLAFCGCSTNLNRNIAATNPPIIRVRLLLAQDQVLVTALEQPTYRTDSDPAPRTLQVQKSVPTSVTLTPAGWRIGGTVLGTGILTIQPVGEGSVAIAPVLTTPGAATATPRPYRGHYRFVPVGPTRFDVINDVDIDAYVAGVVPRELYRGWHEETYKAQAIIARTYAIYEMKMSGQGRQWDVFADERSQVYGGILDETEKSRNAVNATSGIVVTYAPNGGQARIFKTYFSSCCGGMSQSAADAFGEPFFEPLQEQNNQALCNASPRFNWGPVVISKVELTRRFKAWGAYRKKPEKDMGTITAMSVLGSNTWGRPTRFAVEDSKQLAYSLTAEEFRSACNWDASNAGVAAKDHSAAPVLYSSFVKVITDADAIRFVEGHGFGHGVGMCQYCSERRAEEGMLHEDIVLAAYPKAKLMRAY